MSGNSRRLLAAGAERLRPESGQVIAIVAICLVVFIGMVGLVIDVGRLYVVQRQLQTAVDAAALAAAQDLPNGTQATLTATSYDGQPGAENAIPVIGAAAPTVTVRCLSVASAGISCSTGDGCPGPVGCNAIRVSEQVSVNPWFMGILGFGSRTVTASATASMAGGVPHPLDAEMVVDTSGSMRSKCGATVAGVPWTNDLPRKLDCANAGIRALLGTLYPCSLSLASCTPDPSDPLNVQDPVDRVGLMIFPAMRIPPDRNHLTVSGNVVQEETDCVDNVSQSNLTYGTTNSTNQVVPFSSDYRSSSTAALNPTSPFLKGVWWKGLCAGGVYPIGGGGGSSSIVGGGSGDTSVASNGAGIANGPGSGNDRSGANNGPGIANGPGSGNDRSGANNGTGIAGGPSGTNDGSSAANGSAITGGPGNPNDRSSGSNGGAITGGPTLASDRTNAANGNGITGGPGSSGNTTGVSVANTSTIPLTRPVNRADGDFLLATVTAQGSVSSRDDICAPSDWTLIDEQITGGGSNRLLHATYYSIRSGTSAETYTFTIRSSCPGGSTDSVSTASAIVVRYSGVDAVDSSGGDTGNGNSLTAPAVTAQATNDRVVRLFGSGAASFSAGTTFSAASSGTVTGVADSSQAGAGSTGTASATSNSSDRWAAQTVTLRDARTSISIDRPATRVDGDFLLVTVTAEGLGGGNVCAPNDGTWTLVRQDKQPSNGTGVTQATFRSFRSGTASETYAFGFRTGACPSSGNLTAVPATAVAVRYAGVDTTTPIDVAVAPNTGSGTTLTALPVSTVTASTRIVRIYGTGATSFNSPPTPPTYTSPAAAMTTGISDAAQAATGTSGSATAAAPSDNWVTLTLALRPQFGATSISIDRPATAVNGDFLLVSVTAQGLGGGNICAPNDGTWTLVRQDKQPSNGTGVGQAVFRSFRSGTAAETYTFTFRSGNCPNGGSALTLSASAVAVRYTGVDPVNPLDVAAVAATNNNGAPTAPSITPVTTNDRVVSLYGTAAASFTSAPPPTFSISGNSTTSGISDALAPTAAATSPVPVAAPSANWVAQTVALRDARSSITINRPANRAAGDFLLVSVAAKGLAGGSICAPDGSWTQLLQTSQGSGLGSVTQAVFWSFRSGAGAETYQFTFRTGSCPSGGSAAAASASALAVRYTGIDPNNPIDGPAATPVVQGTGGNGGTLTAPSVTPQTANDRVVSLFATGATSFTSIPGPAFNSVGSATANGVTDAAGGAAGTSTPPVQATAPSDNWVAQTIALRDSRTSITVNRPANRVDGDFLLVSVTAKGLTGGTICAPDSSWNQVSFTPAAGNPTAAGSIAEATFWSLRNGTAAESYQFSFVNGASCSSGSPAAAPASAVLVRYTGVDPSNPIDRTASSITPPPNPGTTVTAPAVTPAWNNDRVVSLYGTGATSFQGNPTFNQSGASTATLVTDAPGPAAGVTSAPTNAVSGSSADWVGQTVALRDARTSITVSRPNNAADNDFLLASVTARGLGAGTICPADKASWKEVIQTKQSVGDAGGVTQAVFRSFRTGSAAESYTFNFVTGTSCAAPGAAASAAASAIVVRYTEVDPTNPIDTNGTLVSAGGTASGAPGTTITAPAVTTYTANDQIVRFYGTGATSIGSGSTYTQAGVATASGVIETAGAGAATATAPSANWVGQTLALNTRTSLTIERPPTPTDADFILVTVSAQNLGGSGMICPPNDGSWTSVLTRQQPSSGSSVTQATFYTIRSTLADEHYEFTFRNSSCSGTPIAANASAVAVRYTGVNLITPVRGSANAITPNSNPGKTLTAPSVPNAQANDQAVYFYSTATSPISGVSTGAPGSGTATGFEDASQTSNGSTGSATATTGSNAYWIGETIVLEPSGPGCGGSCWYGIQADASSSTSYDGAINAAEAALESPSARPTAQKVIIFLSDGAANTNSSTPCQDGIRAAQAAEAAGTWVFAIAYDAQSDTCDRDSGLSQPMSGICAMHLIVDNPTTDPALRGMTIPQAQAIVCQGAQDTDPAYRFYNSPGAGDLTGIFQSIGVSLTSTRLISDNAT